MAEAASEAVSEPGYIPALDGVRGIAILLVMLHHFVLVPAPLLLISDVRIERAVARVADAAWIGVDLFFVLSGFLITRILLSARNGNGYFRSFYARRALRIFPLYYGFLFVFIVILPWLPGLRGNAELAKLRHFQVDYWTYLYNVAISWNPAGDRGFYGNGHFWSLAVEEQFYLVWPAIVLLLTRRNLGIFCVLCIIAAPVLRYGLIHGAVPHLHNVFAAASLMPARMDALAIGGLLAVVATEPDLLRKVSRWAIPVGAASGLYVVILFLQPGGLNFFAEPVQVFGYSAVALAFASFLAAVVGGAPGALQAVFGHRVLTFFGRYSYGLYVVHFQITWELTRLVNDHGGMPEVWGSFLPAVAGFVVVATVLSVAVAWLSWHLYEKQFLKLKRFVPYGKRRQRVAMGNAPSAIALAAEAEPAQPA